MKIYESKYWVIFFEQENSIILPIWHDTSSELEEDGYKYELSKYTEKVEEYKPTKLLLDARKANFPITPEIQEWLNENVLLRTSVAGLKYVAIVLPIDFIPQLSMEQAMEEPNGVLFNTKYFADMAEARLWLLSDTNNAY